MRTHTYYSATCPTCGRPSAAPYRETDAHGKVLAGCVDEFHTGHLVTPSASAAWHARPDARRIRTASKAGRMGGITRDIRELHAADVAAQSTEYREQAEARRAIREHAAARVHS